MRIRPLRALTVTAVGLGVVLAPLLPLAQAKPIGACVPIKNNPGVCVTADESGVCVGVSLQVPFCTNRITDPLIP